MPIARYGLMAGKKTGELSPKSVHVPLWRWHLIGYFHEVPEVEKIKEIIAEKGYMAGYVVDFLFKHFKTKYKVTDTLWVQKGGGKMQFDDYDEEDDEFDDAGEFDEE